MNDKNANNQSGGHPSGCRFRALLNKRLVWRLGGLVLWYSFVGFYGHALEVHASREGRDSRLLSDALQRPKRGIRKDSRVGRCLVRGGINA